MQNEDAKLDALLMRRKMQDASPDLAERIILAAQAVPQRRGLALGAWLMRLFEESRMPRPAYALASVLMLGFFIGFGASSATTADGVAPQTKYVQEFLYDNGAVL